MSFATETPVEAVHIVEQPTTDAGEYVVLAVATSGGGWSRRGAT